MTVLTSGKTLQRQTAVEHKGRPLCVELHPGFIKVWPKGTKEAYCVDWESIFHLGAKHA